MVGWEFAPGVSVLVGRLLFWTCLHVCSSQNHCCPNYIVRCAHPDQKSCPALQLLNKSTGWREDPRKEALRMTQTGPLMVKMLSSSQITMFFQKCEIKHSCWNKNSWWGYCVMPCLKEDFFSLCVCFKRMRREVLQRNKTSAAVISLSWMIRIWSLGVNLSHQTSDVNRVSTDPFPCNWNQNTVADSPREDLPVLFGQIQHCLVLLTPRRFAKVYIGTRRKGLLLKLYWLALIYMGFWTFRRWRRWFIKYISLPGWVLISSFSFRV